MTDTNPDNHFGAAPGINLVKLTNGTDNDTAARPLVPVGSTVTFTYMVTNTGNVPLSGVTVRDDNGTPADPADDFDATFVGGDADADGLLDLTETWTFTASRIATAGQYTNLGTATGTPPPGGGPPVTDTNPDNHFGAAPGDQPRQADQRHRQRHGARRRRAGRQHGDLHLPRHQHRQRAAVRRHGRATTTARPPTRPTTSTPPSSAATPTATACSTSTETWTFTASRIATAGQYTNLGTATGTPPPGGGPPVTDTNPDNHFGAAPGINSSS